MTPKTRVDQASPPGGEVGPAAQRRGPVGIRTCVACRQEAGKRSLVRVVRGPEGVVQVDLTGRAPGRGAYLHPDSDCVANARRKRALERALHATVGLEVWTQLNP